MATILGSINNDNLYNGTTGNDSFITSLGSDYVQATAGNDSYNLGYAKSASYWKITFRDFDSVDYRYAWNSYGFASDTALKIVADLQLGTVRKLSAAGTLLNTDKLIGADGVWGTPAADKFYGRDFWDFEQFYGFARRRPSTVAAAATVSTTSTSPLRKASRSNWRPAR